MLVEEISYLTLLKLLTLFNSSFGNSISPSPEVINDVPKLLEKTRGYNRGSCLLGLGLPCSSLVLVAIVQ